MIYILSDIHGQYERYKAILEKIDLQDEDTLYVLGDVIDRGPASLQILFDIMERPNAHMFLGNHEHMMLTYLEGSDRESWFYGVNGGARTYEAYLKQDEKTRQKIVDYLLNETIIKKDLWIGNTRYILSHTSALNDGVDMYTRDYKDNLMEIQDIVWNMGYYDTSRNGEFEKGDVPTYFISGHIITRRLKDDDEIFIQSFSNNYTWIDIDCGCAMGSEFGYLACLRIDETDGQIKEVIYMR